MFQPIRKGRERAADLIERSGYGRPRHARGGDSDYAQDVALVAKGVHAHERAMHPGRKETRLKLSSGGHAGGGMAPARLDKSSRGRGKRDAPQVNIAVVPHSGMGGGPGMGGMGAMPPPAVPPRPPMPAPPPPAVPPRPPMVGPGLAPAPGMPPGGMGMPGGMAPRPMGMRRGGHTRERKAQGGMTGRGGIGEPRFEAGAGSGRGRTEKREREGAGR